MIVAKNERSSGWRLLLACFSQIMEVEADDYEGGSIPALKASSAMVKKLLQHPELLDDALKSRLMRTFTTFADLVDLAPDVFRDNRHFARVKTFAPVEMIAIAVLISHYGESRSNELLVGDIRLFRQELRRQHHDLLMNSNTWRTIWNFIDNLESLRGATNGTTRVKTEQGSARTTMRSGRRAGASGSNGPTRVGSSVANTIRAFGYTGTPSAQSVNEGRIRLTDSDQPRSGSAVSGAVGDRTSRLSVVSESAGGRAMRAAERSAKRAFSLGRATQGGSDGESTDDTTRAFSPKEQQSRQPNSIASDYFPTASPSINGPARTASRQNINTPDVGISAPIASAPMASTRRKRSRLDLGELDLKRIKAPPSDD